MLITIRSIRIHWIVDSKERLPESRFLVPLIVLPFDTAQCSTTNSGGRSFTDKGSVAGLWRGARGDQTHVCAGACVLPSRVMGRMLLIVSVGSACEL